MIWRLINFIFKIFDKIYFSAEKKNWSIALKNSKSYEDNAIVEKIIKTYEQIENYNFEFYERDGILFKQKFDEIFLLNFLTENIKPGKFLEVLDFGGSLGSRFFSNYNFINKNNIIWNIVEQNKFVEFGKKKLNKNNLQFYCSIDECSKAKNIDCVIFSNSLQYLEKYDETLKYIKKNKIKSVFIDFLPVSNLKNHKIFVQNIPKKIYKSSYPIRIFSKDKFINEIKNLEFDIELKDRKKAVFYGFDYYLFIIKNKSFD